MKSINKYTINVRRQTFIKAIRNQQREQIKAQKRERMLQYISPLNQIWRLKESLQSLDQTENKIIQIIGFIREHSYDDNFCMEIRTAQIVEVLIEKTLKIIQCKSDLSQPFLIERLFELVYHLLAKSNYFLKIVQYFFKNFLYLLYKYPKVEGNLQKIAQFFTCLEYKFTDQNWKFNLRICMKVAEQDIIQALMKIYILQNSYEVNKFNFQIEIVKKGESKWFKNAIKCLQICYSLIIIYHQRSLVWQKQSIKESIFQGLRTFSLQKQFSIQTLQWQSTDSDSMSQFNDFHKGYHKLEYEQNHLYFVSLLLDILLVKQGLLEQKQINILKQILQILLGQLNKYNIINLTAIKIIKIFYEQVILNEDDLKQLSKTYNCLQYLIQAIVENDLV